MRTPKLDDRDRQELLQKLREMAPEYVPEWRWDDSQPDAGVVFAHLYAAMMENTISKYNRTAYNHYLSFLNLTKVKLMPPLPAQGMITVGVAQGAEKVRVEKGSQLYAAAEVETGRVFYETTEAMEAVDAEVDRIFFTSSSRDSIVCAYDRAEEEHPPVRLFGFELYPELQEHLLYFRDDRAFFTKDRLDLSIDIVNRRSAIQSRQLADFFSDGRSVCWESYDGEGWQPVEEVLAAENGVRLLGRRGSRPVVSEEHGELGLLRCRLKRIPPGGVRLTDVSWRAQGALLDADAAVGDGVECKTADFSPFGDDIGIYTDFCVSSREAFSKAGALIEIDFDIGYYKTPIEQPAGEDNTVYRTFMTQEDFLSDKERDVLIQRTLWEYWNGMGWARLFPDGAYEDFFTPDRYDDSGKKKLVFRCPADMAPVMVGASEGPFIRARIDKLSHMIHVAGNYIAPFIHRMKLSYRYDGEATACKEIFVRSDLELRREELPVAGDRPLVTAGLCPDPAMYLCLTGPLVGGPLRIFCEIGEGVFADPAPLRWEYYGITANGEPGWKSIEVMDRTENLTKSAIVTLVGKKDFVKTTLFGSQGYFVRLVDSGRHYDHSDWRQSPVLEAIRLNTVPVIQREERQPEYFFIQRGEAGRECQLSAPGLLEAAVWVNELGSLSAKEEERMLRDPEVLVERSQQEAVTAIWVPWRQVQNIDAAEGGERVYEVEHDRGVIRFGDGRHGRIPPSSEQESIMVRYRVCSGRFGNIRANEILGFSSKPEGVSWVTNFKPLSGGADRETVGQAAQRSSGELMGMGRIVTTEDFRRSVLTSNRNIARVRCLPHVDRYNRPAEGKLAAAVLPRQYRQGEELFETVIQNAREAIEKKASLLLTGEARVDLFEAHYVELSAAVEVVIGDYDRYHEVYQQIRRRLEVFLDPITGNFDGQGWEIGQLPDSKVIYNSIKTVQGVKWIKGLHLFCHVISEKGRQAVDFEQAKKDPFGVPVFGEPDITLVVE